MIQYILIEEYYESALFQETVQSYFDTVLAALWSDHSMTETKGMFMVNGIEKRNDFDMPYPIHILNGLIPTLKIYEQYLKNKKEVENPDSEKWLKVFMLGFTLHDANKLVRIEEQKGKSDLEMALLQLHSDVANFRVTKFFPDFEKYRTEVFFLALSTEDRTRILANEYAAGRFVRETLSPLCHLADGLASIQELESPATVFENIRRKLDKAEKDLGSLPISYVEVRPNPYTLTSQRLLYTARKVLAKNGKKVFYALRNGFVFFGEDVNQEERMEIQQSFLNQQDLDPVGLTKVDAQKCEFGFLGSIPFTPQVLDKVVDGMSDQFLALSPNSPEKIQDFNDFVEFLKKLLTAFSPADQYITLVVDNKSGKLYLRFTGDTSNDESEFFRKIFCLHKMQWLNAGKKKQWGEDFNLWTNASKGVEKKSTKSAEKQEPVKTNLPSNFEHQVAIENEPRKIAFLEDVERFVGDSTNSSAHLLKTIFCIAKTWQTMFDSGLDYDEYVDQLQMNIISEFSNGGSSGEGDTGFIGQFLFCRGEEVETLANYHPVIPRKDEMCLFSGAKSESDYTEGVAFGVKARGFSNRTVTTLNNTTSTISRWFSEENKLRISNFPQQTEANLCLYTDFFETSLDISRDIITSAVKAKGKDLKVEGNIIEFDKNARYQYNLFNLDFVSLKPTIKDTFWQLRKWLLLVKKLGLRVYVTGIMSPYFPHKAAFHFENAPSVFQAMGWHQVRLKEVQNALDEMKLVILFGHDRIDSNLLQISVSRRAYFRLYYLLKSDDQNKVRYTLIEFVNKHQHQYFQEMTLIEKLVEAALPIEKAAYDSSGAQETWLIRTATDLLRTYVKQGRPREEIIAKISGEIYRKMRREYVADKLNSIENFAAAVYDLLYVEGWKKHIPTANVQKDWIYEFAFVFKKRSNAWFEENKRNKASKSPDHVALKAE